MRALATVVLLVVVGTAGCAGGVTGVSPPPACPSPATAGCVAGTVAVSVAAARPLGQAVPLKVSREIRRRPTGLPEFVPNQLLVKFRHAVLPAQMADLHRQLGTRELKRLDRAGVVVLQITGGDAVPIVVSRYRAHPLVEVAEPNYYRYPLGGASPSPLRPLATPNDPAYQYQWHYVNVNLPSGWNVTTGSSLVAVAVIDSGILFSHEDLSGVTVAGYDFFDDDTNPTDAGCPPPEDLSHGSHVAGTIAAATNNSIGVAGVNWGGSGRTKIMPLRIIGDYAGICAALSDDLIAAIYYAADHSARVINLSLGGSFPSLLEQNAINYAYNTGVIVIAAAGNNSADCSAFYPAAYDNVVGVAATDYLNGKAWYSNFGSCVDVAAPGGDTTVDRNGDTYADGVLSTSGTLTDPSQYWFFQGTSMAAPHVAGLAALLISKGVTGPANVQSAMEGTATNLGPTLGRGLINAELALGTPGPNPMKTFSGDTSGNVITVLSDMVTVASNGTYLITNAQPGTRTVFAWQDTNGNSVIDGGDLYGTVSGVMISAGSTVGGINIAVSEVPIGTPPISPTGGAASR